jgi:hypothetical protein
MYGTYHSAILSMRVTPHCTVDSITYRYKWISFPVYSKYNISVFQERRGVECDITGTVKVIVAVRHSTVYNKIYSTSRCDGLQKQFT